MCWTCYDKPIPNLKSRISTHYRDTKGDTNYGGGLAKLGSFKVTGNSAIQWSTYQFLLAFHSNYYLFYLFIYKTMSLSCTVSEI